MIGDSKTVRDSDTRQNGREGNYLARLSKSIAKATGIVAIAAAAYSSFYTIDQYEQAIITQVGRPVKVILNPRKNTYEEQRAQEIKEKYSKEGIKVGIGPGLKFKKPFVQDVNISDRRILRWNGDPEEVPTRDKRYIWIDATARFYIEDPLQYLRSVRTEQDAQGRLDDVIDSAVRNSITQRDLIEVVRTDNRKMQLAEEELRDTLSVGEAKEGRRKVLDEIARTARLACREYGIGINEKEGVFFKGIIYTLSVKEEVENRMIKERSRIAGKYESEGNGEYEKIMGEMKKEMDKISSEAFRTARETEGVADKKAADIYAEAFNQDPEFYKFTRTLSLYGQTLTNSTHLLIGTDNPLFQLLKGDFAPISFEKHGTKRTLPASREQSEPLAK